jgi:hypothetical protein
MKRKQNVKAELIASDLRQLRENLAYGLDPMNLPARFNDLEAWQLAEATRKRLEAALAHAWQVSQIARNVATSEQEIDHYTTIQRKIQALADLVLWASKGEKDWKQALSAMGIGK